MHEKVTLLIVISDNDDMSCKEQYSSRNHHKKAPTSPSVKQSGDMTVCKALTNKPTQTVVPMLQCFMHHRQLTTPKPSCLSLKPGTTVPEHKHVKMIIQVPVTFFCFSLMAGIGSARICTIEHQNRGGTKRRRMTGQSSRGVAAASLKWICIRLTGVWKHAPCLFLPESRLSIQKR